MNARIELGDDGGMAECCICREPLSSAIMIGGQVTFGCPRHYDQLARMADRDRLLLA